MMYTVKRIDEDLDFGHSVCQTSAMEVRLRYLF